MTPLFGPEGEAALARIAGLKTLYAFDFDGTLAPIVTRPEAAVAARSTDELLSTLGTMVPTAVVSGRSVADLRQRLAFTPLHLIGNHGAEGLPSLLHTSLADSLTAQGGNPHDRQLTRGWLSQWPSAITRFSLDPGIEVEDKTFSLSIHYRLATDHDEAARAVTAAIATLVPQPHVIGGKCVFNVLPEGAPDKGQALLALVRIEHCDAAFFVGDDVTDESVFRIAPDSWVTVKVGSNEASAARFCIDWQADVDACLARLIAHAERVGRPRVAPPPG